MEHKPGVKSDAAIQHGGIGEKTSLAKKSESGFKSAARKVGNGAVIAGKGAAAVKRTAVGIAKNPIVKAGGKAVSTAAAAADRAIGSSNNEVVQLAHKSLHVASGAVRLGGKTVKVAAKAAGKTIKTSFKLSRAVAQKVRLAKMKDKPKFKVRTGKLYKVMSASLTTRKYVLKPAAKAAKAGVKFGASAAGTVIDKAAGALGNVDNDTAQFAKKAYDVAKTAGALTLKAGKGSAKIIKGTGRKARRLLTKKGRGGLVKSVKRSVRNVKRTIRTVKNAVKLTVKVAKFIAKMAAKAAKLAAKLAAKIVEFIAETAPWSLIVIAVIVLLIIVINVVIAICGDETENQTAGLVGENGNYEELYENLANFETLFAEVSKEKITEPLKSEVTDFCSHSGTPQRILSYNGTVYYPASGKSDSVNSMIENYVNGSLSTDRYVSFLAALKVLTLRETGDRPLDSFTKADFEKFIGTVDGNTCSYGDTFFIKKTVITDGETCPGANCRRKTIPGCKCACRVSKDGKTVTYYCGGHYYCNNDHQKLTVTLRTVEEYYDGKTVPEIYGFSGEETLLYDGYVYFMKQALEEMNDPDNPYIPRDPSSGTDVEIPEYKEPEFSVNSRDTTIIVILVVTLIMGLLFKKEGGRS